MDNELITEKAGFKKYWKWLAFLAVLGIFGICVIAYAASGLDAKPGKEIAFDSEKWKIKQGLDYPHRIQMLNDLLVTDTLRNATKEQILQLLGEPNQMDEVYIFYTVAQKRIGLFPVNTKSLVIRLSKDGGKNKVMSHG